MPAKKPAKRRSTGSRGGRGRADFGKERSPATQFGGPRAAPANTTATGVSVPYSIRNELRHMATQEVETLGDERGGDRAVRFKLRRTEPAARLVAAALLESAMNGDTAAAVAAMDHTEGRLSVTNINADLDRIAKMTDEELLEENRRLDEQLAQHRARKVDGGQD